MLTRVAVFEGTIEADGEDAFFADIRARLEPTWRRFPHVLDVRVLRMQQADPGAVPIVMVLEMDFPDLDAIHASLASDIKTRAHATTPHAEPRALELRPHSLTAGGAGIAASKS